MQTPSIASPVPLVNVYCDGSISDAEMIDPFNSQLTRRHVGRVMVLVPDQDLGVIAKTFDAIMTRRGTPDSVRVEYLAICKAVEVCELQGFTAFTVHSDCQGAVQRFNDPHVCWASREKLYLPNAFFDRVLGRAGYLRQTATSVARRRPVEPYQTEIFELLQAPEREFQLSKSALWERILKDVRRHPEARR